MNVTMIVHREITHDSRVQREARALAGAGHSVTVIQLGAAVPSTRPGGYGFRLVAVRPAPAAKRRIPLKAYRLLFGLAVIRAARRTRPDVVHAHDVAMLAPAYVVARLCRATLVYDTHELATGVPYRTRGWTLLVRAVERLLVRRSDAVITVSDGIARRLRVLYSLDRLPLVLMNVPEDRDANGPPTIDLRAVLAIGGAPLVLHQGAAAHDRGCEALIAALWHLPAAHLVFLGGGEPAYLEKLASLAGDHRVAARVHFVPAVPAEELLAHTRQADAGTTLLEANCENHRLALPNKVFEYVAAGVPVVSNDLPELRALIERHGIGWTAPSGDPEALARAIAQAIRDRRDPEMTSRLEQAALALSWSRERRKLIDLYLSIERSQGARLRT